jgi:hypothetical protein
MPSAPLKRTATIVGLSSATIALVSTAVALVFSIWTFHRQLNEEATKAFNDSLAEATDNSKGPDYRIAGIWQLSRYWATDNAEMVAHTLSAILVTPDKPNDNQPVREAAAEVIGRAIIRQGDGLSENADKLSLLLYGNGITGEWGTVTNVHRELLERNLTRSQADLDKDQVYQEQLQATREAIRKNWEYLENANFRRADLRGILLYEADLKGANLQESDLRFANLRLSKLSGASVRDADFECADLEGAEVTSVKDWESVRSLRLAHIKGITDQEFNRIAKAKGASDEERAIWCKTIFVQCDNKGGYQSVEQCVTAPQ